MMTSIHPDNEKEASKLADAKVCVRVESMKSALTENMYNTLARPMLGGFFPLLLICSTCGISRALHTSIVAEQTTGSNHKL